MKKFFILLLIQGIAWTGYAQEDLLQQAVDAYSKGAYREAVVLYDSILSNKGEAAEIYYNIGNCYYKLNQPAPAILNYERALLLDPGNGDIRFNLEMTKLKTVDRIEPIEEFFLSEWISSLQNSLGTNEWAWFGVVMFLLFIGCLFLFFFSRKIILKKVGFYAGLILVILIVGSNIFSYKQKKKLTDRNTAIVLSSTVTIKSSPDNSGTDLFLLHEGTKVIIKDKLGDWSEIVIADGNTGWIRTEEIEVI